MMNEQLATQEQTLDIFHQEQNVQKFQEILGARAPHYLATLAATIAKDTRLQECTPESLIIAALRGAADNLSFDPALAEAYMVGYKNKVKVVENGKDVTKWVTQANFQYGYKGLIQLGVRTGQYVALGAHPVTQHAFKALREKMEMSSNPVETAIQFFSMIDFYPELTNGQAIGYIAYFKLTNGFTKMIFWDKERCINHGLKHSPSAEGPADKRRFKEGSFWLTNEDTACLKTVIRQLMLSGEAPKSKQMVMALEDEFQSMRNLQAMPQRLAEAEARHQQAISNGREDEELFGSEKNQLIIEQCDNWARDLMNTKYQDGAEKYFQAKREQFKKQSLTKWEEWLAERVEWLQKNGKAEGCIAPIRSDDYPEMLDFMTSVYGKKSAEVHSFEKCYRQEQWGECWKLYNEAEIKQQAEKEEKES